MMIPTQCQLWHKEHLTNEDIQIDRHFECVNTFGEGTHEVKRLLRCKDCDQLYMYEYYEWIDWIAGDDPSMCLFLPVESEEEARRVATLPTADLLRLEPHVRGDWPERTIRWVRASNTKRNERLPL